MAEVPLALGEVVTQRFGKQFHARKNFGHKLLHMRQARVGAGLCP